MKRTVRSLLSLAVIASALMLTACHKPPPVPAGPDMTGTHPLTPYQRSLVSQIRRSGVRVIKQAEVLQIILPTDTFFRVGTTNLRSRKIYAVNKIATLVKSYVSPYRHPRVTITGYTDHVFARQTAQQISKQYAREIAAYLWNKGLSQRSVRIRGYGSKSPIASNRTPRGSAYNRRVVIQVN